MRQIRHNGRGNGSVRALAGAVAALLLAPAAPAAYVQLSQTRHLDTRASANAGSTPASDDRTDTSDALGAFDRTLTSSAAVSPPPPPIQAASATGVGRQSLQFTPTSIVGSFDSDAQVSSTLGQSHSEVYSFWSTRFRVDRATPFDLDGLVSVRYISDLGGLTTGTHDTRLIFTRYPDAGGPEVVLYEVDLSLSQGVDNQRTVDFSGVLDAGYVYSFAATANAFRGSSSGPITPTVFGETTSQITFTLTAVPEPGVAGALTLGAALLLRRRRA